MTSQKETPAAPAGAAPTDRQAEDRPGQPAGRTLGWQDFRRLTAARIGLGHTGISLPTGAHLDFQLAHARARDAVHHALDVERVRDELQSLPGLEIVCLHSRAETRADYLRRPDLGRRLDDASRDLLLASASSPTANPASAGADVLFVVADGLSSIAIERNAAPFMQALLPLLAGQGLRVGPLALVKHGRVAIGDDIAECLNAPLVVVLIGERPGLSAPDSMGIYLTWNARVGTTDEARNCISNVRPEGLPYPAAARRLMYLIREARTRKLSGVALKDESGLPGDEGGGLLRDASETVVVETSQRLSG